MSNPHMKINFFTYKYINTPNYLTNFPKIYPMASTEKMEIHKEDEPYGLGCALEAFTERDEVEKLIDNLKNAINEDLSFRERSYEKFAFILSLYSEQPHLLDKHIPELLEKFINIIRDTNNSMELKHMTFKYLFVLVNVRGYKVIVNQLPHEVADFEPVLQMLEAQDPNDCDNWTTRYTLLLWLSIIVRIPFHMSRLDGILDGNSDEKTVMGRVLELIKTYCVVSDKCRDAAALLAARFLSRSDVKSVHLTSFLEWAKELGSQDTYNIFQKHGIFECIAIILKHGKRDDLLPYARDLLQWIISPKFRENTGSNVNKLVFKIIQRIGLIFLAPRLASWRYKRGNRSLATNLSAGDGTTSSDDPKVKQTEEDDDEEAIVPEEVEEVIDQLVQGLANQDGIVRWSAAKGIGRVTGRLPKELADEVVGSVLQLFNPREGDGAWHGGCLALAELGRRGLLLPQRLPEVVPVVIKALVYDEPRGYSSVGSHIRDAACYVCWSFARAYDTDVLKPYVNQIACTLIIVTCFDREINCRRAASAAFQENVGRQGTFPHGINILTCADFFAVSVRNNAYLQIAPYIAQFEEYTLSLIDHLVEKKVDHWDVGIRELTAKALHNLTASDPNHMVQKVLPALFAQAYTINLNGRHGAVIAIGEIVHALSVIANGKKAKIDTYLNDDLLGKLRGLIRIFREKLYFRGMGGELMKQACCTFIEKCSLSSLPFHGEDVVDDWLCLVNECIPYNVVAIRNGAIKALPILLDEYFRDSSAVAKQEKLVEEYLKQLSNTSVQETRMGHALALGFLPKFMLKDNLESIIEALIEASMITQATLKWAEARRDCVRALCNIVLTLGEDLEKELPEKFVNNIFNTFLEGLKDYTQDKRGDIGAWMREASMTGLQTLILFLTNQRSKYLKPDMVVKSLSNISQQAVEKIDRTRALAGRVFYSFIHNDNPVPYVPHHAELISIFPKEQCDDLNWNSANFTFPKFVQLLQFPDFTYNILLGLICSVGGLTETLVKYSASSLFAYLDSEKKLKGDAEMRRICEVIHQIFVDYHKNDRITVPMFKFLDKVFDSGCLECVLQDKESDFAPQILKLIQAEIAGCKDIYKLIDGVNTLCQFIQIKSEVCEKTLIQLSIMLCHRHSYIRRSTATRLYESLLVNGDASTINPDNMDQILQLLGDTNWEEPVEVVKPIRNELCKLMGVRVPTPKAKPVQGK
ncbi:tubulin-specific chaperone D [Coccinella septempunctata]|uniref:tubulin-specific chaperone D n=1 Tax=Coccinella septempunctata TaxID=41139 RepID=UPI001D06CA71|nr:tubulin-specific chaperone D [Coccinella septempunctata]